MLCYLKVSDIAAIKASAPEEDSPPVVNAGSDMIQPKDTTVTLNGSATISDGNPVKFQWEIVSKPGNSSSKLSDSTSPKPTLHLDRDGIYKLKLTATGKNNRSDSDSVEITAYRIEANAGEDFVELRGEEVTLKGSATFSAGTTTLLADSTTDLYGNPVKFQWEIQSKPSGSTTELEDITTDTPRLHLDKHGVYDVNLTVSVVDQSVSDMVKIVSYKIRLPDTGQTKCYNNTQEISCPSSGEAWAQDGSYKGYSPSYTNNEDGTFTDNLTGLVWHKRPGNLQYTWSEASDYCTNLTLRKKNDWRLPHLSEWLSIINYGDTSYYLYKFYWSSTEYSYQYEDYIFKYIVDPYNGKITFDITHLKKNSVRCVRGQWETVSHFRDNGDEITVTDLRTGLMWPKDENDEKLDWQGAIHYCETSDLAGYDDWRLPNIKELEPFLYERKPSGITHTKYPYISSTPSYRKEADSTRKEAVYSTCYKLGWKCDGLYVNIKLRSEKHYFRCVRGGYLDRKK